MSYRSAHLYFQTPLVYLAVVEFMGIFGATFLAGVLVYGDLAACEAASGPLYHKAIAVGVIMLLVMIAMGLYQIHERLSFRDVLARIIVSLLLGSVLLAAISYMVPAVIWPPQHASVSIMVAMIYLLAIRLYFVRHVDDSAFRHKTLIYGAGSRAACINGIRHRAGRRGFKIVGTIPAPGDTHVFCKNAMDTNGQSIYEIADECGADEIVVAMDNRRGNLPVRDLLDCKLRGIDVMDIIEFLERETDEIRIDLVTPSWMIFSAGFQASRPERAIKRTVDIIVSSITLLVSWPIMLGVAFAIKIGDGFRKPVFYRQTRVGIYGRHFSLLKFRSMDVDAEPDGQAVWAKDADERVTRVGRFIRMTRLDELPQVFNILRGQMSLVGPRPERPEFVAELTESIPYYSDRHTVKPGLTGWAQLKYSYGSSTEDAVKKLQYDLYYIKNQNFLLDLVIMLQTAEVILWRKGAR